MKSGKIIEYIENGKIVCAVIIKADETKPKILVESNREIKLHINRITHRSSLCLDLSIGKAQLIKLIKQLSLIRNKIAKSISLEKLWQQVQKMEKWIKIESLTNFCFQDSATDHEKAGLIRAIFNDKFYFKFKPGFLYPNSKKKIAELKAIAARTEYTKNLIKITSDWINISKVKPIQNTLPDEIRSKLETILCSFYIFGKSSIYYDIAKKIMANSNINSRRELFDFLVKIGVWDVNENTEIFRLKIPTQFSPGVIKQVKKLKQKLHYKNEFCNRVDLTDKTTISIDGLNTLDFDDALSIEKKEDYCLVGIHISDVSHYIKPGDEIDKAARERICSIYMPDMEIPMIPHYLSKDICSLKKGEIKATISTMVKLNYNGSIIHYSVFPSIIKVDRQFSYDSANKSINQYAMLNTLYEMATKLRTIRIKNGAVQISLPEINIYLKKTNNSVVLIDKVDRESPSRIIVAEMMILSNWVTAQYLSYHKIPAIFRSQPEPRKNMIKKKHPRSLYHNWMQKKMLRKLNLKNQAKRHCILGLDAYITSTSPIRKYSDLVTQRQIKAITHPNQGYTLEELKEITKILIKNTTTKLKVQSSRYRYWLLKHLESKIGERTEALVLQKKHNHYNLLLKSYMIECTVQQHSSGISLKPQDIIQVIIQHVSARSNVISVLMR